MRPNSGDNINKWVLHTTGAAAILEQCKISENPSPLEKALLIHVKTNCVSLFCDGFVEMIKEPFLNSC